MAAVDGDTDVTTGSGDMVLGEVAGRARLRTGSGACGSPRPGGPTESRRAAAPCARRGGGRPRRAHRLRRGALDDACSGRFDLTTGSGELRVAVHPGVRAELDLARARAGRAASSRSAPWPRRAVALHVRGRTGSGDVLVTRAPCPPDRRPGARPPAPPGARLQARVHLPGPPGPGRAGPAAGGRATRHPG